MTRRLLTLLAVLATTAAMLPPATAQTYPGMGPAGMVPAGYAPAPYAPAGFVPAGPVAPGGYYQAYPIAPYAAPMFAPVMPVAAITDDGNAGGCDSCDGACDGACDGGCSSGGCKACGTSCCCSCGWKHHIAVFGEFLYFRVRDNEVAYAVEFDGPLTSPPDVPLQQGPLGIVDQDFSSGYRAGIDLALDCYSAVRLSYTYFDTTTSDQLVRNDVNNVVRSLVRHPSSINVASDGPIANAAHDIRFDLVDVEYRQLWDCGCDYELILTAGVRYGRLEQNFESSFGVNGIDQVETDIDFDGAGLRLGVEGERYLRGRQLMVYGKAAVSLLAGRFTADYWQRSAVDPTVVYTNWEAGRIMSLWDLEVGGGWVSRCNRFRLTAGYAFGLWDNVIKTDEWINAVQRNNYLNLGDQMTLDGVVARFEGRF
ncbi:MAG: hypothetical protein J5I93_28410 [Pirellulaceae bacterium]|nr:hypothetical protein [Pirellulaceae bacterium]